MSEYIIRPLFNWTCKQINRRGHLFVWTFSLFWTISVCFVLSELSVWMSWRLRVNSHLHSLLHRRFLLRRNQSKIIQQFWTIFNEPRAELCWHKLWWGEDENARTEFSQTIGLRIRLYRVQYLHFRPHLRPPCYARLNTLKTYTMREDNLCQHSSAFGSLKIVLNRFKT